MGRELDMQENTINQLIANDEEETWNHILFFGNNSFDSHPKLLPVCFHQCKRKDL